MTITTNLTLSANSIRAKATLVICCRYVEEAEVDDEAEVTVNEIDDQVPCFMQTVISYHTNAQASEEC